MSDEELYHILALLKIDGVGDIIAKKLISHFGSAQEVFKSNASKLISIDGIGSVMLKNLKDKLVFLKAEQELKFIKDNNINTSYYLDENYLVQKV